MLDGVFYPSLGEPIIHKLAANMFVVMGTTQAYSETLLSGNQVSEGNTGLV